MFARNTSAKNEPATHANAIGRAPSKLECVVFRRSHCGSARKYFRRTRRSGAILYPTELRKRGQSKLGPGSVLRAGEISQWPTISAIG